MIFKYTCINKENVRVEGDVEAQSFDLAVAELQKRGLVVVNVEEKHSDNYNFLKALELIGLSKFFKPKIKQKDIVIFSRQIATLFEAGVSALRSFKLLAVENENPALSKELNRVADYIEGGMSLSSALANIPEVFEPFYVSMVKTGEESGKLNESFLYLADHLDREYELNQKTRKALTYPMFVVGTFIVIMGVMFVFVIPKMAAMFADNGAELPFITKIVLGVSGFFVDYGLFLLPLLIVGEWFLLKYIKTPKGKYKFDELKLKLPFIKNLYKKIFLTRFSDNLNTMLTAGVPLVKSLEITSDVVDNSVQKEILIRVSKKVESGMPLSKALYEEEYIPNILIQMVRIGEETGALGFILKNLSNFYKREVETEIDNVVSLIEPAMIVGLGLGVGILVASVLLPMYSLSSSIS